MFGSSSDAGRLCSDGIIWESFELKSRVPTFEPEVIAAAAKRRWGDTEKVATTSIKILPWRGVELSSRYDKHYELDTMADMIDAVPLELHSAIRSVFCDSQATCSYIVELNKCDPQDAWRIGELMERAAGGHNGISIHGHTKETSYEIDPNWGDVDLD